MQHIIMCFESLVLLPSDNSSGMVCLLKKMVVVKMKTRVLAFQLEAGNTSIVLDLLSKQMVCQFVPIEIVLRSAGHQPPLHI